MKATVALDRLAHLAPISNTPSMLGTEFRRDPYPVFAQLRARSPVWWSEELRGWVLTGYEEVKHGMEFSVDFVRPFARQYQSRRGPNPDIEDLGELVGGWMSFFDIPHHTRLRTLLNQVINKNTTDAVRPRIQAIAEALIGELERASRVDLASRYANLLPVYVIGAILGIDSPQDCRMLMQWADELHLFVGEARNMPDKYARAAAAARCMDRYFREEIAQRRHHPRDDGITRMIQAEADGERLSKEELASNCAMLFYAGHETTAGLISLALLALARHKDQLRSLLRNLDVSITMACEEFFRYDGPVQAMVRVAASDTELAGKAIRTGDRLYPFINAANRDPAVFSDPDTLNLARRNNRHIVFGHGVHFCIGSWLARAEAPIALRALLSRIQDLDLVPGVDVDFRNSTAFRAPQSMYMELQWR